jgi:hypoxanthine phosphoribosyltransferase
MNREEALHIFSHSEEIVSADDVNASISGMATAIRDEMSEDFPLVLSVIRLHPPDPLSQHHQGRQ